MGGGNIGGTVDLSGRNDACFGWCHPCGVGSTAFDWGEDRLQMEKNIVADAGCVPAGSGAPDHERDL